MIITKKDFLRMQPGFPDEAATDDFYFKITTEIANAVNGSSFIKHFGEDISKDVVLSAMGYYQDIVADSGIWRSFSTICHEIYGKSLPIFEIPEEYIESELNYTDIRFLCWYILECSSDENGSISPFSDDISEIACIIFEILEKYYDEAPTPIEYNLIADIDIYDQEQIEKIYDFSYWLFWNSYFMKHATTPTLTENIEQGRKIIADNPNKSKAEALLRELTQQTMKNNPTGPLSLFLPEWLKAIVENKSPFVKKKRITETPHKFYAQFIEATGGEIIRFFHTYNELDSFLTTGMKWGKSDECHFPQLKEMGNYVLYVSPEKGLLIAPEVAQFVKHPYNESYDKLAAENEAHTLLTIQGRCPIDLVKHLFSNNLVPDAAFTWDDSKKVLIENWDFFARLYQQSFYRAK